MRDLLESLVIVVVLPLLAAVLFLFGFISDKDSQANPDIEPYHIKLFEIRFGQFQVETDGEWITADQYLKQEFQNGYTVFQISAIRPHHQHRGKRLWIVTVHESIGD